MATTTGEPGLSIKRLQGSPRRRRKEGVVHGLLGAAAGISMIISLAIVVALVGQAIVFLSKSSSDSSGREGWRPA